MHIAHDATALEAFLFILFLPDNIPIIGMLVLVFWFTYLGFREARRNDEFIRQGREDEILRDMME
jgi:hypothetical protein